MIIHTQILRLRRFVIVALFGVAAMQPATAVDSIALELGTSQSDEEVDRFGGALKWDWGVKWFSVGDWYLGGYWELGFTYWDGEDGRTGNDSLADFSITPVFRYSRSTKNAIEPFIELGVGAHVHTESGIGDEDFDVPFAFGSHLGAGVQFGKTLRYEIMYRYQHLSNASIGDNNPGINFHVLQLGYRF